MRVVRGWSVFAWGMSNQVPGITSRISGYDSSRTENILESINININISINIINNNNDANGDGNDKENY